MTRTFSAAGSLGTALLTAVCVLGLTGRVSAVAVVTNDDITPSYSANEVMVAKENGGLPTEIYGGPSATATAAGAAAPLHLPAQVGGGRVKAVEPGRKPDATTRMVLLFNPEVMDSKRACTAPAETGARKLDGSLKVFGVLCQGDVFISQAYLRDNAVSGENDPRYAGSMNRLFAVLMPSRDERERRRR